MGRKRLFGLDRVELRKLVAEWGQPAYRANQLYDAMYVQRISDPAAITTFPKDLREKLIAGADIAWPAVEKEFVSVDGTRRYLLRLEDRETIEAVFMPEEDRDTLCISTQAGCAVGCNFCLTALLGVKRNLTAGEIAGQVLVAATRNNLDTGELARRPVNLVFMGMGEPLLNFDNTMKAVRLLADPKGIGLSTRRMTLSTSGIIPRIADFGRERVRPKLAISLNATTDAVRTELMPHNRKWNITALLDACRDFPLRPGEWLTFEYVLLEGVNDTRADAKRLVKLVSGLRAKVNLIGLNPGNELPYRVPTQEAVLAFQSVLTDAGVPAFVRKPRGRDIFAACGQLKRTLDPAAELVTLDT